MSELSLKPLRRWVRRSVISAVIVPALAVFGCSSPTDQANGYYEQGVKLLEQGDLVKARLEFQNALQIINTMTEATYGLALVAEKQGDWEKMFGLLSKVVDQDPKHLEAQLKLGRLLLAAGQTDRALKTSDLTVSLDPADAGVLALRAAVLYKLDDAKGAVEQANAALAKDPANVDALVVLATERLAADDAKKAIQYLDRALKLNEKDVALQLIKVQALEKLANTASAEETFHKLIAFYPENRTLRHLLAQFYLAHDSRDKAEAVYRRIVEENPTDVPAKLDVIRFLNLADGAPAAIAEMQSVIQTDPANNELKFALASLYQNQGDAEAAAAVLREIMANAGDSADGLKAKGQVAASALAAGKREVAAKLVAEILASDARNEQGLFLKASMAIDDRKLDQAISDLRTILRDVPDSARTLLLLGKAHELAGSPELADGQYLRAFQVSKRGVSYGLAYAEFLLKGKNAGRAERVLEEALGANPGQLSLLKMLAQVRITQGNWVGAQETADEIRRLGDQDSVSDQILGTVQAARKNYDQSIASFKRAYDASPSAVQPVVALVHAYVAAGKPDEAMGFLDSLLKTNPANTNARLLQGQLLALKGDREAAVQTFETVISQTPDSGLGYRSLAALQIRQKRYDEADKVLAQGLAAVPGDLSLQLTQAASFEMAGRFDDAIRVYDALLKERPNADIIANNLASLLAEYRSDEASLKRAHALAQRFDRSDVPQFKDTLGWASYKVGNHRQAAPLLESAAKQMPEMAIFRYHLGMNYLALADREAARRELEKALALAKDKPFEQAEQARKALEGL